MTKPRRITWLGGIVGILLLAPLSVSAKPKGIIFVETMGVSTAVGLILGASTLPFYQSPGSNLVNLAYGAAAGAVVGLGIFTYEMVAGSDSEVATAPHSSPTLYSPRTASLTQGETVIWAPVVSLRW